MPAKSKAQLRYMQMCRHNPKHADGKCPDMDDEQYSHFTSTKGKKLPERKGNRKKRPVKYPEIK